MKRKYHLQDASKKTPAKTFYIIKSAQRTVINRFDATCKGNGISESAGHTEQCEFLGLFVWLWIHLDCGWGSQRHVHYCHTSKKRDKTSLIILIELGIVMTAKSPEMARKTKKAY